MTKAEAISKVKKLLQLGESDNVHESAAAIARATSLMEEWKISEACMVEKSDPEEEIECWDDPIENNARASWKGSLAYALAVANGCYTWRNNRTRPPTLKLVGGLSNVQTVRYLYRYCSQEVDRLTKLKAGNGRTWMNNYRHGCVAAISAAIKAESEALHERLRGDNTGSELMVVNNAIAVVEAEAEAANDFAHTQMKLRTRRTSYRADSGAHAQGRRDGANIYKGGSGSTKIGGGGTRRING